MKLWSYFAATIVGASASLYLPAFGASSGVDHGQVGEAWPIAEPDLLSVIRAKLEGAKASGKLDELNQRFAARVEAKVRRPTPVAGIKTAIEDRSWEYDPTITLESDIRDHKGNLIGAAGQKINPLSQVPMTRKLLFIDGDSQAQLDWALAQGDETKAKIIMVSGSPFAAMKARQRRFYFDQAGSLSSKFGIEHVPASVEQKANFLVVHEVALTKETQK